MTVWTIRPLCFGEFRKFEKSSFTYLRNQGVKITAPCFGFLLQAGQDAILVDSGPSAPEEAARWHSPISRTTDQVPDIALRAAGVAPEHVRIVILSHLHWDHCYNLECFPGAKFVVQGEELRAAVDPLPPQRRSYEVGIPGLRPSWMSFFDRMLVVRGDVEIAPGIQLALLPGHSPGLQGVVVSTNAGRYLLPSDAAPLYENLGVSDPVLPGYLTDVATCLLSLRKMSEIADVILPSHDPAILKQPTYP